MTTNNLEFETERLLLRPTGTEDAAFIFKLMNTPKWLAYIGDRKIESEATAAAYIKERMLPQLERLGFSNYTCVRKVDGEKLGSCGLYDREGLEGVDIGFAFLPEHEGKGYAYEGSNRIMEAGIQKFNIEKISGITVLENKGSQRLLEKLGLTFQKMIRLPNDDEELMLYQWTK